MAQNKPFAHTDDLHLKFIARLKALIEASGKPSYKIARAAKISTGGIYEILNRRKSPSLKTLGKLAKALNVKVRDLLPDDEP